MTFQATHLMQMTLDGAGLLLMLKKSQLLFITYLPQDEVGHQHSVKLMVNTMGT
jgi:hypothetical protein